MRGWIRRTPAAHAAFLEWTGMRRRSRVIVFAGLLALCITLPFVDVPASTRVIASTNPLVAAVLAAIFATATGSARRARRIAAAPRAWTGALPTVPADVRRYTRLHAAAPALAVGLLATAVLLALAATGAAEVERNADARALLGTVAALWIGIAVGLAIATLRRPPAELPPPPGSRYVPRARARDWRVPPTLAALAAWPLREAAVRLQPRVAARAALPVLLLMPAGLSGGRLLGVLALASLALGVVALSLGTRAAVHGAVAWLAPLPVRRSRVAFAVAGRALLLFVSGVAAGAAIAAGLAP